MFIFVFYLFRVGPRTFVVRFIIYFIKSWMSFVFNYDNYYLNIFRIFLFELNFVSYLNYLLCFKVSFCV